MKIDDTLTERFEIRKRQGPVAFVKDRRCRIEQIDRTVGLTDTRIRIVVPVESHHTDRFFLSVGSADKLIDLPCRERIGDRCTKSLLIDIGCTDVVRIL